MSARGILGFAAALLVALAPVAGAARPASPAAAAFTALDGVLSANVNAQGLVDYDALCGAKSAALTPALDRLAAIDPATLVPRERVAFWIDLYNASMLRAVCERRREGWTPAADKFAVFDAPLVRTKGGPMSLNHLEKDVLRPAAKDARIHVALVCAARSCPVLLPRAYRGADLDSLLDANLARFLRDPSRNRVEASSRTLRLSQIFDWYAADFGGPAAVPGYVGHVLGRDFTGWKVEFLDYDWSLNQAERP